MTPYPHFCIFKTPVSERNAKNFMREHAGLIYIAGIAPVIGYPGRPYRNSSNEMLVRVKFPRSVIAALGAGPDGNLTVASSNVVPLGAPGNLMEVDSVILHTSKITMMLNVSPDLFSYYVSSLPESVYSLHIKLLQEALEKEKRKTELEAAKKVFETATPDAANARIN